MDELIPFVLVILAVIFWLVSSKKKQGSDSTASWSVLSPNSRAQAEKNLEWGVRAAPSRYDSAEAYAVPDVVMAKHSTYFLEVGHAYAANLDNLQIVLILDQSGSMEVGDEDPITGQQCTRWNNLIRASLYLADTMLRHDKDGLVPVYFFSSQFVEVGVRTREELFAQLSRVRPGGGTNLLGVLKAAFAKHASREQNTLFVVLTDGQPDAGQNRHIKNLISNTMPKLDPSGNCLNVLFIRIGDDNGAIKFLQELDDCPEIGDWVDTKADNDIYQYGPENLLTNAIYEHLEAEFGSS